MRQSCWVLCLGVVLLAIPWAGRGQQGSPAGENSSQSDALQREGGVLTLREGTHLVVLDVVVTDKKGHTVPGLSKDNFKILEDGQPQTARFFEEHAPVDPALVAKQKAELAAELPVNTFTSYEPFTGNPVNVLVLNKLTSLPDYDIEPLRRQMIDVIVHAPQETRFAIYSLDTDLQLVQPVTTNHEALLGAVSQMWQEPVFGVPPLALGVTDVDQSPRNLNAAVVLARRKIFTAAMQQLSASFGPEMGRKTMFAFTGGLRCTMSSAAGCSSDYNPELKTYICGVMDTLEQARISMYRYYPAGQVVYGFGCNASAAPIRNLYDINSHYYTLYYTPTNQDWNGKYRKFTVTSLDKKLRLSYREGYYGREENAEARRGASGAGTVAPELIAGDAAAAEAAGASAGSTETTPEDLPNPMPVVFTVKVEPAAAPGTGPQATPPSQGSVESEADRLNGYRDYTLHFFVPAAGLRLVRELKAAQDPGKEPYVARLAISAVSYVHGHPVDAKTIDVAADFTGPTDPRIAKGAITASLTVQVPENGPRLLHLTVHDAFSGQMGRLDIPVEKVVLPAQ
jgi:VWFA-related protein